MIKKENAIQLKLIGVLGITPLKLLNRCIVSVKSKEVIKLISQAFFICWNTLAADLKKVGFQKKRRGDFV